MKTDLRVDTAITLAAALRRLPSDAVTVLTLPGEEVRSEYSGAWYYILSREGCAEVIGQYLGGGEFDRDGLFTDMARKDFREIYQKKISAEPYTFDGLMREGVPIE